LLFGFGFNWLTVWGATIILAGSATNMMAGGEESKAA